MPPPAAPPPSSMSESVFVAHFGSVYERSPGVAASAHALVTRAHDAPRPLHELLAASFRRLPRDARLAVLRAHPDLAPRLEAAHRLTAASAGEQAAAGLDYLTDDERDRFQELNALYGAKHGFPFIIAVRDYDKMGILEQFEERLDNDTDTEFETACAQVERIAELRILDCFKSSGL